jgi:FkbM family methyltransferase
MRFITSSLSSYRYAWRRRNLPHFLPSEVPSEHLEVHPITPFGVEDVLALIASDVSSVCHVGAHRGDEVPAYVETGLTRIVLFEPVADHVATLKNKFQGNTAVRINDVAVSDHEGRASMFLASNDGESSSLLELGTAHKREAPKVTVVGRESVEVKTLDNVLGGEVFDLCVLDCQGTEDKVIRGGTRFFSNVRYVYSEISRQDVYRGGCRVEEIDRLLAQHGLNRMLTRWWSSWGDALYVRSPSRKAP